MGHCSVLACQDSVSSPASPSPTLLKWILSLLVCCWSSRPSNRSPGDSERSSECIELGPMTLREYINTLEPYDPELHGWRGDEPRRRDTKQRPLSHPVNGTVKCGGSPRYAYTSVPCQLRHRNSPCPTPNLRRNLLI